MNILWITNAALPEACALMNEPPSPFGGWFVSVAKKLSQDSNVHLSVAFPKNGVKGYSVQHGEKIRFFAFAPIIGSIKKHNRREELIWITEQSKPDIIHIFGTEYEHSLAFIDLCRDRRIKFIVSIQGLVSIYAIHYFSYLPCIIYKKNTIRDFFKKDNLFQQQRKMKVKGEFEVEAIQKTDHVIGRTVWDKACVKQIHSDVSYYHCNETLRDEFYLHKWDLNNCRRNSIVISQASYPIKGLHLVLEALKSIIVRYPDATLVVSGRDVTKADTVNEKLKLTYYAKYIRKYIKSHRLERNIEFVGIKTEKEMCQLFLEAHVFVSASSIENESNSLSEAKLLGVPCIASFVGGVTDRINHSVDGLFYPADEPYMLAHYVCSLFGCDELALRLSRNARTIAQRINDPQTNLDALMEIYGKILRDDK